MSKNFDLKLPPVMIGDLVLTLGLGGLHSVDKPGIFKAENDYVLLDADVTSYYPAAIIKYLIVPAHLDTESFIEVLVDAITDRKAYKKRKKEAVIYAALEYGLKIGCNAIFGLFGYSAFMLHDLLCTYKTTVNNQLFLLQLIESLNLANHNVISANTDGILLYVHKDEVDSIKSIIAEWENDTGFGMEYAEYDLYVRADVNTYIARKTDGTVKIKGRFVSQGAILEPYFSYDLPNSGGKYLPINGILKGFDAPIVALALQKYYLEGIHPNDFIRGHKDIYDFCIGKEGDSQFTNYSYLIEDGLVTERTKLQKTLRFFVSNPTGRDIILKKVTIGTKREKRLVSERIIIPAVYETERRINPASGRMKNFTTKISGRVNIPAVYETIEYQGEKEFVYASGNVVTLFNDYYDVAYFNDYNINYDYYINRTIREITKIGLINDMDIKINIVEADGTVVSTVTGDAADDLASIIDDVANLADDDIEND
jgi:hypothetical protein